MTDLNPYPAMVQTGTRRARTVVIALAALFSVTVFGTFGYMLVVGMSFYDALYMTVITLSTVGYHEVTPLTAAGRNFTMILIILGVGTLFYTVVAVAEFLIEGRLDSLLGRRTMKRTIAGLADHVVVCGYGRIGHVVVEELKRGRIPFVVVERDPRVQAQLEEDNCPYVLGSALEDEALRAAGTDRARAIVAAAANDSDNVFITLSAIELNPKISVHARGETPEGARRLHLAGAHQVISPHQLGGRRIANAIVRPAVVDFIELSAPGAGTEIELEEIVLAPGCKVAQIALRDLPGRGVRVAVVAIKRGTEPTRMKPVADDVLEVGDHVVVIGDRENLSRLAALAASG